MKKLIVKFLFRQNVRLSLSNHSLKVFNDCPKAHISFLNVYFTRFSSFWKRLSLGVILLLLIGISESRAEDFSAVSLCGALQFYGTPARADTAFNLGLFGFHITGVNDYTRFGVDAAFSFSAFRAGAFLEWTSLDSLYERLRTKWEFSFADSQRGLGVGYALELEKTEDVKTLKWANFYWQVGAFYIWQKRLALSSFLQIPHRYSFEALEYGNSLSVLFEKYRFYIGYWNVSEFSVLVGQEIQLGTFVVETAFRYPDVSFYLGFSLSWKKWRMFFGLNGVSRDYSLREWRLEYAKRKN